MNETFLTPLLPGLLRLQGEESSRKARRHQWGTAGLPLAQPPDHTAWQKRCTTLRSQQGLEATLCQAFNRALAQAGQLPQVRVRVSIVQMDGDIGMRILVSTQAEQRYPMTLCHFLPTKFPVNELIMCFILLLKINKIPKVTGHKFLPTHISLAASFPQEYR